MLKTTYTDPDVTTAPVDVAPPRVPEVTDDAGPEDLGMLWLDLGCGD
jgi:hypothetical protein